MLTGKLKYVTIALIAIVLIVVGMMIYRMYFKFKPSKVKDACQKVASTYGDSQAVYQLLIEGCEHILKSPDLSKQVQIIAKAESIELEEALVRTAMNSCISNGMIASPSPDAVENLQESTPNV